IGAGHAAFRTHAVRTVAEDAEAGGAVVERPHGLGRREGAGRVAPVGVDGGREGVGGVAQGGDLGGQVVGGQGGQGAGRPLFVEQRFAALRVPQGRVQVEAVAGEVVVDLGHEGNGLALLVGDLLGAVLVDGDAVGHLDGLGIFEVDLLLARAPFAFRAFD